MTQPPTDRPDDPDATGQREREEALWRSIVANYGDRATLEDPEPLTGPTGSTAPTSPPQPAEAASQDREEAWRPNLDEGHFVPPPPPPATWPRGPRLVAWLGVLLVPLIAVVIALTEWPAPTVVTFALTSWFIGGFGYLVWTMPKSPDDGWDDGARV